MALLAVIGPGLPAVPLSVAALAGALSILNPCAFPLLPAYLASYATADERSLPTGPTATLRGCLVGLAVAGGTVGVFATISVPLLYGATSLTRAVPYAGLAAGAALTVAGGVVLVRGRLPYLRPLGLGGPGRSLGVVAFGVGYGVASLACGLPVFLALVAATLATDGTGPALLVFAAFAAGMTLMLVALSIAAALVREGLARRLKVVLRWSRWVSGTLLLVAGAYLGYYWLRVRFGPAATLADDPIVGASTRYAARLQTLAGELGGWLMAAGVLLVAGAIAVSVLRVRWHAAPTESSFGVDRGGR
jgi:cytochrome c-type biogenesis protein